MYDVETKIESYEPHLARAIAFQVNTIKDIARKFYMEEKQKVVLADEVGMGKTYVCRGLIELGQALKEAPFKVFYIAPNEAVSKQNHSELCDGCMQKVGDTQGWQKELTERLSVISQFELKETVPYVIRAFNANIFFSANSSKEGDEHERRRLCQYIYSAFDVLAESEAGQAFAKGYKSVADLVASAFFKPTVSQGRYEPLKYEAHYWQDDFIGLQRGYEDWIKACQEPIPLELEEASVFVRALMTFIDVDVCV